MPHRHLHRRKQGFAPRGSSGSFNYARPWKVFLAASLLVCCVWTVLECGKQYQYLTAQENLEYHVNDLDKVDFEHPQVDPNWGFFKKVVNVVKKVVKTVVKVAVGVYQFGKAVVNVVGMYLGLKKCVQQRFPIFPAANPWDLGIVQQANYEKPLGAQHGAFTPIAQRYINNMPFKYGPARNRNQFSHVNMQVLDSVVINKWRLLLVRDRTTHYLWVCFRGTTTFGNWIDNARKFFKMGGGVLNSNYRRMGAAIKGWQRKYQVVRGSPYNRLYGFIGHSAGGWYANKVAINYDVWRITLNAYNTYKKSRRHVNFRTNKDPVSAIQNMNNYACLKYCNKGHSNIDFVNCWRSRYSHYTPVDYHNLWKHTYDGFNRIGANPIGYVRVPNQVEHNRNVDPAAIRFNPAPSGGAVIGYAGGTPLTQPTYVNTNGWTRVFGCWGDKVDRSGYNHRWYMGWRTFVNNAKSNEYQYLFVNPRRRYQWAMALEYSNQWQDNVARGKALSYVRNGVNSYGWANQNVFGSLEGLSHNFGYTCNNNNNPNLPNNIYWACGNGGNGFHVIPQWHYCRWSWSGRGYSNFAVELYIKRLGMYQMGPQPPPVTNTQLQLKGWKKAYECSTGKSNSAWMEKWSIQPNSLINSARTNVYAFLFVDPKDHRKWARMEKPKNFFANNLRRGLALSYNGGGGLSQAFINSQVRTSYVTLKQNFAYSCSNNAHRTFASNIYWACGNGRNGFHVIPVLKICRWSWPSNAENRIALYVKKIGRWNPPPRRPPAPGRRPGRSSSSA